MNTRLPHTHFLSPPSHIFTFPEVECFLPQIQYLQFPSSFFPRNPNFKVKVSGEMDTNECGDLVVEACLTRTLSPALTLEHGLESLKEAVQALKLNPPSSTSGMIGFQVAVPDSLGVFLQFYNSKELEGPTHESAFVSENCGSFCVGAAVDFRQSSSTYGDWNSFRRNGC